MSVSQERSLPSDGKDLRLVSERLEFEGISRRVEQKHRPLFAGLSGEADMGSMTNSVLAARSETTG